MRRLALLFAAAASLATPALAGDSAQIYGQQLIEKTLAQHPEVAGLTVSAAAAKAGPVLVVASSLGAAGQPATAEDLKASATGAPQVRMDAAAGRA